MTNTRKTAIVTGASQGIGAGVVEAFLQRGYNVVANSRGIVKKNPFPASPALVLVEGDISLPRTAAEVIETAKSRFGGVDVLVNNVGTFFVKPFTEFTAEDLRSLVSVNIEGFLFITQLTIKEMLERKRSGGIVNVTTSLVGRPIAGVNASVPMITKGGIDAVTRSLAIEYAKNDIRVNAVAPGIVDTPMHKDDPKDFLRTLQPMGRISDVKDVVDAIIYLSEASQVTGEVLHVDGGAHAGRW